MIAPTGKAGRGQVMAEINITPFTDVVLVLLIIFMVSASFMGAQQSTKVNLPAAKAAEALRQKQEVDVTIAADQQVFLNGAPWNVEDLTRELKARHADRPIGMVVVSADRQVPYEEVLRVMDAVKQAGIESIAFPTRDEGKR